jgi:hypothetical protein
LEALKHVIINPHIINDLHIGFFIIICHSGICKMWET